MKTDCVYPGCKKGLGTGDALHRTSPHGDEFEGMCSEHFEGEIDPVVGAIAEVIEQHNHLETK